MEQIKKGRILNWAMYFIAFFCMGPFALLLWTVYQLCKYSNERKDYERRQVPMEKRPEILAMNTPEYLQEHLTEKERRILNSEPGWIFVGRTSAGGAIYHRVEKN